MVGRPKTMASRKPVSLPPELAAAVEDFRFQQRFKTESEAIRQLIELGLGARPILQDMLRLMESLPPDPDMQRHIAHVRKLLKAPDPD